MTAAVAKLIERESDVKAQLKDVRQELKEAVESSQYYKSVLEATLQSEYNPTEKAAKAHALKVTIDHFTPKNEE
jgi:hypothetical protein